LRNFNIRAKVVGPGGMFVKCESSLVGLFWRKRQVCEHISWETECLERRWKSEDRIVPGARARTDEWEETDAKGASTHADMQTFKQRPDVESRSKV
jgi:hypothetical protein